MQKIDTDRILTLTGYERADFASCIGCRICASVCTVNDFFIDANPQGILLKLFLGMEIDPADPLIHHCVSCYRCTDACPWRIRIPEVIRAIREEIGHGSPFEKAFRGSISIWGRVYEPYIFMNAMGFLIKEGYLKHIMKLIEYLSFHLPHKAKRS
ncbi:MAG: 4Fe-4S dicluster domain-containing protein [Syntrophorhabdaceae bacterium]|nr:4Fe-4S dicluster domain-containing protein [Syntrophorhabdaceae bacterium]